MGDTAHNIHIKLCFVMLYIYVYILIYLLLNKSIKPGKVFYLFLNNVHV